MSPLQFLCPCCDALLRMRPEQVAVVPEFNCPACHRAVRVVSSGDGVNAVPVATASKSAASDIATAPRVVGASGPVVRSKPLEPQLPPASDSPSAAAESAASRLDRLVERTKAAPAKRPTKSRTTNSAAAPGVPWYLNPLVIAWASAFGFAAVLLGYALYQNWSSRSEESVAVTDVGIVPTDVAARSDPAAQKLNGGAGKKVAGSSSRERLTSLGVAVQQQLTIGGSFPAGTWANPNLPVERRFSWLARLVEAQAWQPSVPVVWDRAWNDPLNEAFVRRRVSELQNPSISQLTGGDGYPATHYAGMAGVGADAASLPADDPRAGIFGDNRHTRVRDVVDGLANTILMTGVQQQLGSWSAGGSATVRGLSREPYVNGPDGLGTGQVRGMLVLMADGSVREISADAAPALVRRLATISDERKLPGNPVPAPAVPAAPAAKPPVVPTEPLPGPEVAVKPNEEMPPLPPAGPPEIAPGAPHAKLPDAKADDKAAPNARKPRFIVEPIVPRGGPAGVPAANQPARRVDADRALRIKLLRYQRDVGMPLKTILDEIAEMSGIDIVCEPGVLGGPGMEKLDTKITLNLGPVTIRDVLATALQKAGLTYKVEHGQVHVIPPSDSP